MAIRCNRCSYENFSNPLWAKFVYETPSGLISIPVALGWCFACEKHAAIEDFMGSAKLSSLHRDLEFTESRLEMESSKRLSQEPSVPWWKRLMKVQEPDPAPVGDIEQALISRKSWLSSEVRDPSELRDYFRSGRSAKCLACGGQEVLAVPMEHPGCGGEFYQPTSNIRGSMARKRLRVYALSGDRLPQMDDAYAGASCLFLG